MNWQSAIQLLIHQVIRQENLSNDFIVRLEVPIEPVDLIAWLAEKKNAVKLYWSARDTNLQIAAIDVTHEVRGDDIAEPQFGCFVDSLSQSSLRYLGGIRFGQTSYPDFHWRGFDGYRFILPLIELKQEANFFSLACHLTTQNQLQILQILQEMNQGETRLFQPLKCISSLSLPSKDQWIANIHHVLTRIENGDLDKIVLAKQTHQVYESNIDALALMTYLKTHVPLAYHFYLQFEQGRTFLGASPERLYLRQQRKIHTEAQAGTRVRGNNLQEDEQLAKALLESEKDHLEHNYVLNEIEGILKTVCLDYGIVQLHEIVKFSNVQHLRSQLSGILKESIDDAQILQTLHPTSAVCGLPRQEAKKSLQKLEPFDRGYYAGAVGFLSGKTSEFAVGIRSVLIEQNQLFVYAGAGIVKGSKAEDEWQEIQNKMGFLMRICQGHDTFNC